MKFISLILIISCSFSKFSGSTQLEYQKIEKELYQTIETSNFYFHISPNDTVDTLQIEAFYNWAKRELLNDSDDKIHYYKYLNKEQMKRLTNRNGNAFVESSLDEKVIHSIHPKDNHEITHVLMKSLAPVLFAEGLAVAHQTKPELNDFKVRFNGSDIDSIVIKNLDNLPLLDKLLVLESYRKLDSKISYPLSGSFIKFLKEEYSIELILNFCKQSRFDDEPKKMKSDFKYIFKTELELLWKNYISTIR